LELEVKRDEIWTVAGGPDYAGKPRPMVIVQDDRFSETNSITLCGLTSSQVDAPFARPSVAPSQENGLRTRSWLMVDKITTVPKSRLGYRVGRLGADDVIRLNRHIQVFLGLVG
jgi:mRNA interferase MazF